MRQGICVRLFDHNTPHPTPYSSPWFAGVGWFSVLEGGPDRGQLRLAGSLYSREGQLNASAFLSITSTLVPSNRTSL